MKGSTSNNVGPLDVLRNVPVVLGALEEALDVVRRIEQLILFTLHQLGVHSPISVIQMMELR